MTRCGVLGRPVRHSLSPVLHRAAYAALGLDWDYTAHEVDEGQLARFVRGCDASWRGLSLTMPLKRAVLPLFDEVTPVVRLVGAANTLVFDAGRRRGDNTDVGGVAAALAEAGVRDVESALVLGAGATAASAVVALAAAGLRRVELAARDVTRAAPTAELCRALGLKVTVSPLSGKLGAPVELVLSTVPASAAAVVSDDLLHAARAVFDVVYDPWPSPLLARAAAGVVTLTGIDLLAHQAGLQVVAMTGQAVPVDVLRAAATAALESRG